MRMCNLENIYKCRLHYSTEGGKSPVSLSPDSPDYNLNLSQSDTVTPATSDTSIFTFNTSDRWGRSWGWEWTICM